MFVIVDLCFKDGFVFEKANLCFPYWSDQDSDLRFQRWDLRFQKRICVLRIGAHQNSDLRFERRICIFKSEFVFCGLELLEFGFAF